MSLNTELQNRNINYRFSADSENLFQVKNKIEDFKSTHIEVNFKINININKNK